MSLPSGFPRPPPLPALRPFPTPTVNGPRPLASISSGPNGNNAVVNEQWNPWRIDEHYSGPSPPKRALIATPDGQWAGMSTEFPIGRGRGRRLELGLGGTPQWPQPAFGASWPIVGRKDAVPDGQTVGSRVAARPGLLDRSKPAPSTNPQLSPPYAYFDRQDKDVNSAMAKLMDENNALRRQLNELNEKASEWRGKAAKCDESERQLKAEMNKINEDRETYIDSLEKLTKTIEEGKDENLSLKKTIGELQAKIGAARNPGGTKRAEVSLQTDPHVHFNFGPQLRQLQGEFEGLKRHYNELNEENKRLKQANGELLHVKTSLEERNAQIVEGKQAEKKYAQLDEEVRKLICQVEDKDRQLGAAAAELEQLRQANGKFMTESVHRSKYEQVKAQREEIRGQFTVIKAKYVEMKKTTEDAQAELEETKTKLSNVNAGNDALGKSWKELCSLKDRLKTLPSALQSATDAKEEVASLRRETEEACSMAAEFLNTEITKILTTSSNVIKLLEQKSVDAQEELEKATLEISNLKAKLSLLQDQNTCLRDQLKKAEEEVADLNTKHGQAISLTHVLQEKLGNEKRKLEEASNEIWMKETTLRAVQLTKEGVEENLKIAQLDLDKAKRFQTDLQKEVEELRKIRQLEMTETLEKERDELQQKGETLEKAQRANDQQEMEGNSSGVESKCEKYKQDLNASRVKNRHLKEQFRKAVSRCNTLDQSNNRFAEKEQQLRIDLDSAKREIEKLDVYRRMYGQALKVASTLEQKIGEFVPQLDPNVQNAGREFLSRFSVEFTQQLANAHADASAIGKPS